jgi:hypothetical protein
MADRRQRYGLECARLAADLRNLAEEVADSDLQSHLRLMAREWDARAQEEASAEISPGE